MATFIMFGRYSMDGMKGIRADRTDKASALVARYGGEIKEGYALLGAEDLVLITEFASVEQAMKASIALSKLTGIAFTTAPAVTMAEFDRMAKEF